MFVIPVYTCYKGLMIVKLTFKCGGWLSRRSPPAPGAHYNSASGLRARAKSHDANELKKMSGGGGEVGGEGGGVSGDSESSADLSGQLIRASKDGDLGKVKYLVKVKHVDPHSCRGGGYDNTPLHWASLYGHLDIVRYLVEEQQCDVKCRNKHENTPLHDAAMGGRLDIVQYLISERGCDPMCRGRWGSIPLHYACLEGKLNVVKYLVEDVKVEPSCRDEDDVTPLHMASLTGHLSVMRLLVEDYLCDPAVRDKSGETPADYAQSRGHTHITSYLSSIEKIVSSELVLLF